MAAIRIYVEGGGDGAPGKRALRLGFARFLREFEGRMPQVMAWGGRNQAYEAFVNGLTEHPDEFVILLVDSEGPVESVEDPRGHLARRPEDHWDLRAANDEQVHLMVQAMETWIIADRKALQAYYGQGFRETSLPKRANLEEVPKDELERALVRAAGNTSKRGYSKLDDGPKLLAQADPQEVRSRCASCRRLFRILSEKTGVKLPGIS